MRILLWSLTAIITALTAGQWTAASFPNNEHNGEIRNELFDPSLQYLNTLDKLIAHIDDEAGRKAVTNYHSQEYVLLIDEVIRNRFYHGISHIRFGDNFIAYLAGKFIWEHFAVGVTPDEILNHPHALCSQSAIIFQEVAKRKGLKIRAIGLQNHFCSEVFYDGSWHFMDSDFEPHFNTDKPIPSVEELAADLSLTQIAYEKVNDQRFFKSLREQFDSARIIKFGVNEFPAKNMRVFQYAASFCSNFLWIILLALSWYFRPQKAGSDSLKPV